MLFDPAPKTRKEDLYDREAELEALFKSFRRGERLIVIQGVRRIGKSSLLNVALAESGLPYIKIDVREIYFTHGSVSRFHLYEALSGQLTRLNKTHSLLNMLKRVRGVSLAGVEVRLDWRSGGVSLAAFLKALDRWCQKKKTRILFAIDEAQYLRFGGKTKYGELLAWSVDNLAHITFVLTGSEVGLLRDFLGFEEGSSPLYGRFARIIGLNRLSNAQAKEFLLKGFDELGIEPPENLDDVIKVLDGLIGWLTHYGYMYSTDQKVSLTEFLDRASETVKTELTKILRGSDRYFIVLKSIASGAATWSEVYNYMSSRLGPVPKSDITILLRNLVKYGFVEEEDETYSITDPVVKYTVSKVRFK